MFKCIMCCILTLLLFCPLFPLAEDCEHYNVVTYYDDHRYIRPIGIDLIGHTYAYTEYRLCLDCSTIVYSKEISEAQLHSHTFSGYTNLEYGHDSNNHWEIGDEILACVCGHTKTGDTDVQYLYGAHYSGGFNWIDAGHSGLVHYYDAICDHSTCKMQYRYATVSCPGGDYHVAPASIIDKPVVTE